MITHNMKDAIKYGNRLIMMYEGHVIYDVKGEEKKNLQVSDLLQRFEQVSDGEFCQRPYAAFVIHNFAGCSIPGILFVIKL